MELNRASVRVGVMVLLTNVGLVRFFAATADGQTPPPPSGVTGTTQPGTTYSQYPAPKPEAARQPRRTSGFLAMPFVGMHSVRGDGGRVLDLGFRLGTLLGGRVTEFLSLNGEVLIDVLNPGNVPEGVQSTQVMLDFAFSPLFHARASGDVEFVLGPKLGFFGYAVDFSSPDASFEATARGWVLGANAGLFVRISPGSSLGGIISYAHRQLTYACTTIPGLGERCADAPEGDDGLKLLGFSLALLF